MDALAIINVSLCRCLYLLDALCEGPARKKRRTNCIGLVGLTAWALFICTIALDRIYTRWLTSHLIHKELEQHP